MTLTKPIARQSLHAELVDRLRDLLVADVFKPGTKIPEADLCKDFAVSRTPMREALKVLASEGLVHLLPNRGAWVAEIDIDDLEAGFPVLAALEALAGELACARISDAEITRIRTHHYDMLRHYENRNQTGYFMENQAIHAAIMDAAANPVLSQQHASLAARMRTGRFKANLDPKRWAQAISEHVEMLKSIEARDGQRLARVLKAHFKNKLRSLKQNHASETQSLSE